LKAGNVAYGLMLVALALLLAATVATAQPAVDPLRPFGAQRAPALAGLRGLYPRPQGEEFGEVPLHLEVAEGYVGTVEEGVNRGPVVEQFQRAVGIPPGSAWCAAFVGFVLGEAERQSGRRLVPAVRSGVATAYLGRESVRARDVLRGVARPPVGSLVIWRRGATWRGHVGFVLRDDNATVRGPAWYLRCGRTIEGNTSSGAGGSQAGGDGVWERVRCIQPGSYFRIVAFTPVQYGDGASP